MGKKDWSAEREDNVGSENVIKGKREKKTGNQCGVSSGIWIHHTKISKETAPGEIFNFRSEKNGKKDRITRKRKINNTLENSKWEMWVGEKKFNGLKDDQWSGMQWGGIWEKDHNEKMEDLFTAGWVGSRDSCDKRKKGVRNIRTNLMDWELVKERRKGKDLPLKGSGGSTRRGKEFGEVGWTYLSGKEGIIFKTRGSQQKLFYERNHYINLERRGGTNKGKINGGESVGSNQIEMTELEKKVQIFSRGSKSRGGAEGHHQEGEHLKNRREAASDQKAWKGQSRKKLR